MLMFGDVVGAAQFWIRILRNVSNFFLLYKNKGQIIEKCLVGIEINSN